MAPPPAQTPPPEIFAPRRRLAARRRMLALQRQADAPRYVMADMVEDAIERLAFLRHAPARALVIGDWTGGLAAHLRAAGAAVTEAEPAHGFADDAPLPFGPFDFIAALDTLATVNDLPGALIHLRACTGTGRAASSRMFPGAGSLAGIARGDSPVRRRRTAGGTAHPSAGRCARCRANCSSAPGWTDPVIDSRSAAKPAMPVRSDASDRRSARSRHAAIGAQRRCAPATRQSRAGRSPRRPLPPPPEQTAARSNTFEIVTLSGRRKNRRRLSQGRLRRRQPGNRHPVGRGADIVEPERSGKRRCEAGSPPCSPQMPSLIRSPRACPPTFGCQCG